MKYQIKQAKTELDLDAIAILHIDSFMGGAKEVPDLEQGFWWIMWNQGSPIAFAGISRSVNYRKTAYLCRAAIRSHHRGQGLQKRLIHVRERWVRAQGDIEWIVTDTWPDNHPSNNSLINCGYKLWQPNYGWRTSVDGMKPLYWRKLIQK